MRKMFFVGSAALIFAFSSMSYTKYTHKQKLDRNKTVLRLSALKGDIHQSKALSAASKVDLHRQALIEASRVQTLDQGDFQDLIYSTDRLDRLATEAMVQRLRDNDLTQVGSMFIHELKELGSENPEARAQLIFAANLLQADELSAFWADIALRTTPRSADEAEVMGMTELTLDAKVIHGEMAAAIRNLGLIGYRQPIAHRTLEAIILHPQPLSHPTFVREYAFYALKEADERVVLRILRGLPNKDPLRVSLQNSYAG